MFNRVTSVFHWVETSLQMQHIWHSFWVSYLLLSMLTLTQPTARFPMCCARLLVIAEWTWCVGCVWAVMLSSYTVPWIQTPWIHCCPWPCRTVYTCLWEKHRRTLVSTVSYFRCSPGSWGCCTSHTAPPWSSSLKVKNGAKLSVQHTDKKLLKI